jgi:hypothetical protein
VTPLDLDEVSKRFMNKRGSAFKPDSVKIYKARVASAIQDFLKYKADPLNFKVGITSKPTTITRTEKNAPAQANPLAQHYPAAGAFFGAPPSLRQPVRDRDRCPDPDSAKHDCQNRGVAERPDQAGGCEARKYYPSLRDRR